jgi:hypothetical protein
VAPTLLFLAAFVALRIQQPQLERKFRIPGECAVAAGRFHFGIGPF